jgi:hypothetical protein
MSSTEMPDGECPVAVRYMLDADAEPGLLSRLLAPFARCDLLPDRTWSHRAGEVVHLEIAFDAIDPAQAALMEKLLSRVVGVRGVVRLVRPAPDAVVPTVIRRAA